MRVVITCALLALSACGASSREDVLVLTYASPYSPTHPFSRADRVWMDWVEHESRGTLRIQPFWSGSVLSSEHSMTELRHGVADIGLITPIYARGGAQLIRAQAGYYGGLTTFEQQVALYRCLEAVEPHFARELHDLVVLAVQGGNLPGIVTRDKPVRALADLQGLRLRAPAELLGILKHFGADPVDMPMGEVYSALAKGVLDGVVAPADTLRSLHFAEVARYYNTIAIPRGAYAARAMGQHRWQSLTAEQRELLRRGTRVWERALEQELAKAVSAGEAARHQHRMQFTALSAADQQEFLNVYNEFAARNAARLQRFGIDGMKTYRYARELAANAKNGALPCEGVAP